MDYQFNPLTGSVSIHGIDIITKEKVESNTDSHIISNDIYVLDEKPVMQFLHKKKINDNYIYLIWRKTSKKDWDWFTFECNGRHSPDNIHPIHTYLNGYNYEKQYLLQKINNLEEELKLYQEKFGILDATD